MESRRRARPCRRRDLPPARPGHHAGDAADGVEPEGVVEKVGDELGLGEASRRSRTSSASRSSSRTVAGRPAPGAVRCRRRRRRPAVTRPASATLPRVSESRTGRGGFLSARHEPRDSSSSERPSLLPPLLTVGVDIGGTKVAAGVVDGTAGCSTGSPGDARPEQEPAGGRGHDRRGRARAGASATACYAVGIGAAGFVDASRSSVLFAPHLSWRHEPLRDAISGGSACRSWSRTTPTPRRGRSGGSAPGRARTSWSASTSAPGSAAASLVDGVDAAREVRRGGGVRAHAGRARRSPLRVRQPRLLGAVRQRQRAGPRGPRARAARSPVAARPARAGRRRRRRASPARWSPRRPRTVTRPRWSCSSEVGRWLGVGHRQPGGRARPRAVRRSAAACPRRASCCSRRRGRRSAGR